MVLNMKLCNFKKITQTFHKQTHIFSQLFLNSHTWQLINNSVVIIFKKIFSIKIEVIYMCIMHFNHQFKQKLERKKLPLQRLIIKTSQTQPEH